MNEHDQTAEIARLKDRIAELERERDNAIKEIAFWLGEGQEQDPEVVEYRQLVGLPKRTPTQDDRLNELGLVLRIRSENEPEMRRRVFAMKAELEAAKGLLRQAKPLGHANSCDLLTGTGEECDCATGDLRRRIAAFLNPPESEAK